MERRDFIKCGILLAGAGAVGCTALKCLNKNSNSISDKFVYDYDHIRKPCEFPFDNIQIEYDGGVFPCCPTYLKFRPFGNIYKDDLMSIWTGNDFEEIRQKMLKGDFSMCNRNECYYRPSDKYTKDFNAKKQLPSRILLCYDKECNYKCITCRDEIVQNTDEELKILDNEVMPRILPFITKLDNIIFSGGDPLASRHSRKLIKNVCKNNPNIRVSINTQGYFMDENNMKELGITKLDSVSISIHSATRKTYEKIMRQDSFDRIMKNLAFVSDWKKKGLVNFIGINFVVHSMNYKEMPAFVKIAEKFDATANFWGYNPWVTAEMHNHYKEVAVFETWHKDYPKLQKILKDPVFKSKHCFLYPELMRIAES